MNNSAKLTTDLLARYRDYLRVLAEMDMPNHIQAKLDPSDLVQQTLLRAWASLDQLEAESPAAIGAWLRKILARTISNSVRDLHRDRRNILREQPLQQRFEDSTRRFVCLLAPGDSPSEQAIVNEQILAVSSALLQLPKSQRQALVLRYIKAQSLAEIAEQMQRSSAAVASLLQRGLQGVRHVLDGEGK